jgi:hypothetical protein
MDSSGWRLGMLVAVTALALAAAPARGADPPPGFDHFTTGFELTGQHRLVPCESCHVDAVFRGTPRLCAGCHAAGSRVSATPKPAGHVISGPNCEQCHTTSAWTPARYDHSEVQGACATCHNGTQATGRDLRTSRRPPPATTAT